MPDRTKLRPGDHIRLLAVPACDLAQREREIADNVALAGWTADTIERILATNPIVTISHIDEFGAPWFDVEFPATEAAEDELEYHSLTILDNDSWERCA